VADGDAVAVLDPVDAEIVRFATLVTRDAAAVTAKDVDRLRAVGLSDEDISTSPWPWPPTASSAPSLRPSGSSPTRPTRPSTRTCARP
jgi:hypothetical protein